MSNFQQQYEAIYGAPDIASKSINNSPSSDLSSSSNGDTILIIVGAIILIGGISAMIYFITKQSEEKVN